MRPKLKRKAKKDHNAPAAHAKESPSYPHPVQSLTELPHVAGNVALGRHLQAKLAVSQPGDPHEQEADQIADTVMRMQDPAAEQVSPALKTAGIQRDSSDPEAEKELISELEESGAIIQRHPAKTAGGATPPTVTYAAASALSPQGGQPLPLSVRNFMEPRFGRDFSDVRLHTDTHADAAARSLNAHAFTVGRHVTFAEGQYAPETSAGQRLIAHELSHVVQQDHRPEQVQRKIIVDGKPYTPTTKYYSYLDGEGLGVMKEFIKTMHNDGKAPDFNFSSFEQMGVEVRVRHAGIKGMEAANTGTCQYPDAGNPTYLDTTYWEKKATHHFKAKSPFPAGKGASDAIEAIFAPGSGTRLECMAMTFAVQYRAMMNGMGKDKFNKLFPGGAGLEISNRGMAAELIASKKYKVIGVGSKSEILPGDWVYFKNFKDYLSKHPGGFFQGENAVYMGGGMYSGFGITSMSEKDMNKELVKAYTGNATATDAEVADLIKDGGGLLLNPVARPDIGQFSP